MASDSKSAPKDADMQIFFNIAWSNDSQTSVTQGTYDRFVDHFRGLKANDQRLLRDAAQGFIDGRGHYQERFADLKTVSEQESPDRRVYLNELIDTALEIGVQVDDTIKLFDEALDPLLKNCQFESDVRMIFRRGLEEENMARRNIYHWIQKFREELNRLPGGNLYKVSVDMVDGTVAQAPVGLPAEKKPSKAAGPRPGMVPWKVGGTMAAKKARARFQKSLKDKTDKLEKMTGQGTLVEPVLGQNWHFSWFIGEVSANRATVWAHIDEQGQTVDKVVRKDTGVTFDRWTDARVWASGDGEDMQNMLQAEKEPWEWNCHKTIIDLAESRYVVGLRDYAIDFDEDSYRLYTAFCPKGSLSRLVEEAEILPEPFLWVILFTLVENGQLMERGCIDGARPRKWRQIVHRDLKPDNIFLDTSFVEDCNYPTPRLADFGIAFKTTEDNEFNPWIWNNGGGTPGWRAPEQMQFADETTGEWVDAFKLLAHTNVWGVGAIMWALLHFKPHGLDLSFRGLITTYPDRYEPHFSKQLIGRYSPELLDCIRSCVCFDPARRPTFDELKRQIKTFANGLNVEQSGSEDEAANEKRQTQQELRRLLSALAPQN